MDTVRVVGSAKGIKGAFKEAVCKPAGVAKLEGKADRIEGKVQNAIGGIKDILEGKLASRLAIAETAGHMESGFADPRHDPEDEHRPVERRQLFATAGKKVDWMRANPMVWVEVESIVSGREWQTVVIFGRYQELPNSPEFHEARLLAHALLATTPTWWEPGGVKIFQQGVERLLQPIYLRILIDEISGRQGIAAEPLVQG